jgi:inhibitor of KinA sporulation pathway (predicted exonuclease)
MHYIAFDLEWNIAGYANKVDPAIKNVIPFEIIEIGAVRLDERFRFVNRFSVYVRPQLYPILSGYVAAVTKRLQQSLRFGLTFPDAIRSFRDFCGDDFIFCTWSDSDISTLKMNLDYFGLAAMMPDRSLDVQYLFDALIEQSGMQRSIEYAIDFMRIQKNQPFHQAVSDAHYTGRLLAEIVETIQKENNGQDVIGPFLVDPSLNRTQTIYLPEQANMKEAMQTIETIPTACPACSSLLVRVTPWSVRRRSASAIFTCPEHGRVAARLRIKPKPDNLFNAQLNFRLLRYLEEIRTEDRPEDQPEANQTEGQVEDLPEEIGTQDRTEAFMDVLALPRPEVFQENMTVASDK